jgi:hypothetical protein
MVSLHSVRESLPLNLTHASGFFRASAIGAILSESPVIGTFLEPLQEFYRSAFPVLYRISQFLVDGNYARQPRSIRHLQSLSAQGGIAGAVARCL